jgi:hypothetical protein
MQENSKKGDSYDQVHKNKLSRFKRKYQPAV